MFKLTLFVLLIFVLGLINAESKALYNYVNKYDPNYKWTLNATYDIDYANVYVLELTSQKWLTDKETNQPIWKHFLEICVKKNYNKKDGDSAILYVDGGYNQDWTVPTKDQLNAFGNSLCLSGGSGQITATLLQNPNQYIVFENDGVQRDEDMIVARTWRKYMDTKNSDWVSLNPQTKSAIKAMDAVQEFGKTKTGNYNVKKFVVTGASKRGWVAWGTGMVKDPRVIGIAPMVIPVLNIQQSIGVQYESYGNWSFALQSYVNEQIPSFLNTKYFEAVSAIVDPINYIKNLKNINKYIILSTNDEFFIADSTKFFYNKLKGETKLGLFANNDHYSITNAQVASSIVNFFNLTTQNIKIPQFTWNIDYSNNGNTGKITVKVQSGSVVKALLYSGTTVSKTKRDFRMFTCNAAECYQNIIFSPIELQPSTPSSSKSKETTFTYTLSKPENGGWTGFYIDLSFSTGSTYSTEMAVVPDVYPFSKCGEECRSGVPSYVNDGNDNHHDDDDDDDDDDDQC